MMEPIEIKVELNAEQFKNGLAKAEADTKKATSRMSSLFGEVESSFASIATGFTAGNLIVRAFDSIKSAVIASFTEASSFQKKIIEINTLLPTTARLTNDVVDSLSKLANQFATDKTTQAQAYYQIISAGITNTGKALEVLKASNTLAQAGLGDLETSVLALTKVINNYGSEAGSAAEISDVLFTAVRNGQVNVDQFASTLPKVLAESRALGLGFSDSAAALTALTNQSESADIAATQLRAVFTSLLRSQDELSKYTDKAGNSFNLQQLKAKGLSKYLQDLVVATGDLTTLQAALGGRAEALAAVLKFASDGFKTLNVNVEQFANASGNASTAAKEIQNSLSFQWDKLTQNFANLGSSVAGFFTPAINGATKAINKLFDLFKDKEFSSAAEEVAYLTSEIERLNAAAKNPFSSDYRNAQRDIKELTARIEDLNRKRAEEQATAEATAKANADAAAKKLAEEQRLAAEQRRIKSETNAALATLDEEQKTLEGEDRTNKIAQLEEQIAAEEQAKIEARVRELDAEGKHAEALALIKSTKAKKDLDDLKKKQAAELAQQQTFFSTAITLANSQNKALAAIGKAAALADLAIKTPKAVADSFAFGARVGGPPLGFALGAIAATAMAAQAAQIAGLKGYADGGVIGGFTGAKSGADDTLATVKTGEMVLNAGQQENLFNAISEGALGGGEIKITFDADEFTNVFEAKIIKRRRLGISGI